MMLRFSPTLPSLALIVSLLIGAALPARAGVTNVSPASGPTAGSTAITITGTNLGTSGTVQIGGTTCTVLDWTTNQIICLSPVSQGASLSLALNGTASGFLFSYSPPVISLISPTQLPTAGGVPITIAGQNFGSSGQVFVGTNLCNPTTWTDSKIICTAPVGTGSSPGLTVAVSGQTASSPCGYEAPTISNVSPSPLPMAAGTTVVLAGKNFGTTGTLFYNSGPCVAQTWSQTAIVFAAPESASSAATFSVTVADQTSTTVNVPYVAPSIASITPPMISPSGGTVMSVLGNNFGNFAGSVLVNESPAGIVSWTNTQIVCVAPQVPGGSVGVVVTRSGGATSASFPVSSLLPVITNVVYQTLPAPGGTQITVQGTNFTVNSYVTIAGAT
jgi:hypothetical protein